MIARRVAARVIDEFLVIGTQFLFIMAAVVFASLGVVAKEGRQDEVTQTSVALLVIGWLVSVAYEVVSTKAGTGAGKFVCGIRVSDVHGYWDLSWTQAVLRWLVLSSVQPLVWLWLLRDDSNGSLIAAAVGAAVGWRLVVAMPIVVNRPRRGVHDYIAGTVVMRDR